VGVLALLCLGPAVGVLLHLLLPLSHRDVGRLDERQEARGRGRGRADAYWEHNC
jgi:hypothetical protein